MTRGIMAVSMTHGTMEDIGADITAVTGAGTTHGIIITTIAAGMTLIISVLTTARHTA